MKFSTAVNTLPDGKDCFITYVGVGIQVNKRVVLVDLGIGSRDIDVHSTGVIYGTEVILEGKCYSCYLVTFHQWHVDQVISFEQCIGQTDSR
ncbi:unnamed protein product [marine sediment metagenome]|uniref:Uncharacterized protein n=1 Tax=marine sediment metagenome TaxID=412755 RepID=X1GWT0_9ZZZZ